jgi:hypothetical protein
MSDHTYESHVLEWNGITLEVRYCPSWADYYEAIYGHPLAHIEVEAITPARAPLPITETGYRSHFTSAEEIAEAGGPVAFIRAALDSAADDPAWKKREAAARQYQLF